jgi:preprotein translocase subunit SecB
MDETKQPGIQIQQVLLWSAQFEHRKDALSLPPMTRVELGIELEITAMAAEDGSQGAIVLKVRNNAESQDALYRLSFEMMGIVQKEAESPNMTVQEYLEKNGAATLYPFLREAVANVTARGRFGPLWLKPFNFVALGQGEWSHAPVDAQTEPKDTKEA